MFDGDAFGRQMVDIVRGYVAAELEPLRAEAAALAECNVSLEQRIIELEARQLPEAVKGDKGDPGEVDMEAVEAMLAGMVASIELPQPEKGDPGEPGKDCDMDAVASLVENAVRAAVDALPAPKDGSPGQDGLGLADALIDASGALVLTMTDGTTRNLGRVHGRDGKDGETFGLDDFDIEPIDERTIKLGFTRGDIKHSFELSFPVMIYRDVWKDGESYVRGDAVTWAGSLWVALDDNPGKPDGGSWKLAVKKGRDGKDAGR